MARIEAKQSPEFLARPTRFLFFTGKGGVGKTSIASATALALADSGKSVLLVSTDPASNLDEILGVPLTNHPVAVPGVSRLQVLNIDPTAAADAYRTRVLAQMGPNASDSERDAVAEQLSGSCTTEIAAFDEFVGRLADPESQHDHIIFDTAPTGHTLRLLTLPAAWTNFIETNTTGTSCLGPLAGLQSQRDIYRASLAALADQSVTTVVLVARPEPSALTEAARTAAELSALGITHQRLVVNGVFVATDPTDRMAQALEARGRDALLALPTALSLLPRSEIPLFS